ncbi:MAG: M48 family metallopeptidase [Pseudomonadota bacterium]|nr:M48 family metallopeptidase [Pseudomonadota bacterium]
MTADEARRLGLRRRVEYWSGRLKVTPRVIRIQTMRRKWGSCTTRGIITIAEDLADQDPGFQDFVIAHELLHLHVPNHGKLFKARLSALLPGWKELDLSK